MSAPVLSYLAEHRDRFLAELDQLLASEHQLQPSPSPGGAALR